MNKKILTAAIGAALVAGPLAAQADLKISGRVAMELVSEDGKINARDYGNQRLQLDFSEETGFMGRMALDMRQGKFDGVTVNTVTTTSGSTGAFRDYYVGYKGGFGTLRAGRLAGIGKNVEGDRYIGTFLELRNAFVKGGSYGSSSFVNSMLQYDNKVGDMWFGLQYDPTDNGGKKGDLGLAIKAKAGGANLYAAYNNEGAKTNESYWKVGGSMGFGDITARLTYESDANNVAADQTSWSVGADMKLGNDLVGTIDYSDKGKTATEAAYRVGVYKKFSKKSHMWAGYTQNGTSSSSTTAQAAYGVGFRHDI